MTGESAGSEFQNGIYDQDNFYEASIKWVKSLKERHDPYGFIGILDNDIEAYPFQSVDMAIVPAYAPTDEEIARAGGKEALQAEYIAKLAVESDSVMGQGSFEKFTEELSLLATASGPPGSALRALNARLSVPRHNTATLAFHPNIMALPIYSVALPAALSKIDSPGKPFDFFEFAQRNLMPVNPALSVASFQGVPIFETMGYATLVKTIPPTRSALIYGMDRELQRRMIGNTKQATKDYLETVSQAGKSVHMTIDPTASTFEPVRENGKLVAMKRKPVNPAIRQMILDQFPFVLPMTMCLNGAETAWYAEAPLSLFSGFGGNGARNEFDSIINTLDRETGRLYGAEMLAGHTEQALGRSAVSGPAV